MKNGVCQYKSLPSDLDPKRLPRHIAVIMDGNGRWAQQSGLPRFKGHQRGAEILNDLLRCAGEWGIEVLTVYAFSTENWARPEAEVRFLLHLFDSTLRRNLPEMHANGVRLRVIGDRSKFPAELQETIDHAMAVTEQNQGIAFNIAANYGGRQEILRACRNIARAVKEGSQDPEKIDLARFEEELYTRSHPDPDLLIRTSGEQRLSNFMPWQSAYTEMYFTQIHWPDFDRAALHKALSAYQNRQRRFGCLLDEAEEEPKPALSATECPRSGKVDKYQVKNTFQQNTIDWSESSLT